jgi:hypothetical protein
MTAARLALAALALGGHAIAGEKLYVTLEVSKNLMIVDGKPEWVPVVRVYWKDNEALVSVSSDGKATASLTVGSGKPEQMAPEESEALVDSLSKLVDTLRAAERLRRREETQEMR